MEEHDMRGGTGGLNSSTPPVSRDTSGDSGRGPQASTAARAAPDRRQGVGNGVSGGWWQGSEQRIEGVGTAGNVRRDRIGCASEDAQPSAHRVFGPL